MKIEEKTGKLDGVEKEVPKGPSDDGKCSL
jgi:hypothetical protein